MLTMAVFFWTVAALAGAFLLFLRTKAGKRWMDSLKDE